MSSRKYCASIRSGAPAGEAELPEDIKPFFGHYCVVVRAAAQIRPDAISWLREQERILKSKPQLSGLDMRALWQELALPFQGLETDPPR